MATKTWTDASPDWNTATDWNPSGVPGSGDDVVINSGGSPFLQSTDTGNVDLVSVYSGGQLKFQGAKR